ncbi:MAG: bifunctional UDP-N-acetylmuramoyl-tripeptide:D-alanyl-D-alanine ligase/alanine racemase [Cyclobacteriaceae bacterium]
MLFQQLANTLQAEVLQQGASNDITTLAFDTRKMNEGSGAVFFCIKGKTQNGHKFIGEAYKKGVRNFVVCEPVEIQKLPNANIAKVSDTLGGLQRLAKHHRDKFDIPVFGITGSNGKTMVKEWLAELLSEKHHVVKSPKSYNSQLGVPLSVWELSKKHEVAVFEAGISEKGEMAKLQQIIRPGIGLFTNIGSAHAEGFESQLQKLEEKANFFEGVSAIICCRDQTESYRYLNERFPGKVLSWSTTDTNADFKFEQSETSLSCIHQGVAFDLKAKPLYGYYKENLLHVISAAIFQGLTADQINKGLERIRSVPMRLELKRGLNGCHILDDTYNNDLAGLSIALDYMKQQPNKRQTTVILSDIYQSGVDASVLYRQVNDLLERNGISRFIGVGEEISSHGHLFSMQSEFFPNTQQLIRSTPQFEGEMILVKGARNFALEKVVSLLEEKNHGTVLEVNFESLTHNLNTYRSKLQPQTKMMVMVKAFAYGGGLSEIGHLLQYQKVDYLGVAYLDEAVILRQKGVTLPIMVMNTNWDHFSLTETFGLEPEIYSIPMIKKLIEVSERPQPIHLKIETGMNRLGFVEEDIAELIQILKSNPQIHVAGIFTHFSSSEEASNDEFTQEQAEKFNIAYDKLVEALGYSPIKHALNSSGIVRWSQYHFDMVRLGIGLYGYDSSATISNLRAISSLKSRVSQIRKVKSGESIGYSRMGTATKDGKIAVVPIGYADGYFRKFGRGSAYMTINGQQARTIGNVCMDMTMLDVTGLDVKEGDEVIIFGKDPNIEKLAGWGETIPYEILTNVSQRVKRVFVSE